MTMTGRRPLTVEVPDGTRLEAELDIPADAHAMVVLAHPHPQRGGSMEAGLIDELFRSLPGRGVGALRFNFRGVGGSTGTHGEGIAEIGDVAAAIEVAGTLAAELDVPLALVGWSFGADVSLAVDGPALAGWVLIAPPLRILPAERWVAASDARPKLALVPEHDQFRPPAAAAEITGPWAATRQVTISGADHFLFGSAGVVADHVVGFLADLSD